jgi:hypothetical protein
LSGGSHSVGTAGDSRMGAEADGDRELCVRGSTSCKAVDFCRLCPCAFWKLVAVTTTLAKR